jgi:hypothetical protein
MEKTHLGFAELFPSANVIRSIRPKSDSVNIFEYLSFSDNIEKVRVSSFLHNVDELEQELLFLDVDRCKVYKGNQVEPIGNVVPLDNDFPIFALRV